jgi:hypothetical protein
MADYLWIILAEVCKLKYSIKKLGGGGIQALCMVFTLGVIWTLKLMGFFFQKHLMFWSLWRTLFGPKSARFQAIPFYMSKTWKTLNYSVLQNWGRVIMFNATFNNISVILWRSVLLVEETGVPGENHRSVASHWKTLSLNVVSSTPRLIGEILMT